MKNSIDVGAFRISINNTLLTEVESDAGISCWRTPKGAQFGLIDLVIQNIDNKSNIPSRFHLNYYNNTPYDETFNSRYAIYGDNNRGRPLSAYRNLIKSHKAAELLNVNTVDEKTVVACRTGGYKGIDGAEVSVFGNGCSVRWAAEETLICRATSKAQKGDKLHILLAFRFADHILEPKDSNAPYKEPETFIRVNQKELVAHFGSIEYVNGEKDLGLINEREERARCAEYGVKYEWLTCEKDYLTVLLVDFIKRHSKNNEECQAQLKEERVDYDSLIEQGKTRLAQALYAKSSRNKFPQELLLL